jgi:tocopherol O-methyltransferase
MGGSSILLAKEFDCRVTGITLSPLQRRWAHWSSRWHGTNRQTEFRCVDAEQVEFDAASFDVVWCIECTEHLFDKPAFFRKAADWLRPGGRVAICAWLAGDDLCSEKAVQQVYEVCEGFFCPSLGSRDDYQRWMQEAGLEFDCSHDWTDRVARTWEICRRRVTRTGVRHVARLFGLDTVLFLDRFDAILRAYRTGAMRYGCFIAHKP